MRVAVNLRNANLMITDGHGESMRSLARALVSSPGDHELDLLVDAAPRFAGLKGQRARTHVLRPFRVGNRTLARVLGADPWYRARVPLARSWRDADVYLQSAHEPAPFVSGPPHVAMVHDVAFMRPDADRFFEPPTRAYLDRWTATNVHRAERVIAVSDWVREELVRIYGLRLDRVDVAPHGVDGDRFMRRSHRLDVGPTLRRLGINAPYILFLGTLQPRKNLGTLVRGCAVARHRGMPHELVLAGGRGWRYADVAAELDGAEDGGVHQTGAIDPNDLPLLLAGASAFVSVALDEGFGMPVLEAMASGVPVVAANQGGLASAVGDAGIQVDPMDVDAIANALLRVTSDETLRQELCARGRARASEFTWERAAERVWQSLEYACEFS